MPSFEKITQATTEDGRLIKLRLRIVEDVFNGLRFSGRSYF